MDEKEIIANIQAGQLDYMNDLIDLYKDSLYKFCYHLTRNKHDADDLFQDTWLKVTRYISHYDLTKKFKTWLLTITANLYKDRYRKAKRRLAKTCYSYDTETQEEQMENIKSKSNLPDICLEEEEEKAQLHKAVNKLNDKLRVPIILFYFKEMDQNQIAEILDIPVGTVKSRLNAARKKLLQEMEGVK